MELLLKFGRIVLDSLVFSIKILSVALSALFTVLDHLKAKQGHRGPLFWLAIGFAALAIVVTVVDEVSTSKHERERAADLRYIAALNEPVSRLGFILRLEPVDSTVVPESQLLLRIEEYVLSRWPIPYGNIFNLYFSSDSGWGVVDFARTEAPATSMNLEVSHGTLHYWLENFGISWQGKLIWKPDRVVDLFQMSFQIVMQPHPKFINPNARPPGRWCPIGKIECYYNEFDLSHKLFEANANIEDRFWWEAGFVPDTTHPYFDRSRVGFRMSPLRLRQSIEAAMAE